MAGPLKQLVISQTPYRISLGGGGTDLPFYANKQGGLLISASINQYVKVSVASRPLDDKIMSQTTETQFADTLDELEHPIIREVLRYFKLTKAIQVATFTTIPTGIGLGTSSTLMVGLVKAFSSMVGQKLSPMEIAAIAHHIERKLLKLPGGIQDQYISALGGIQVISRSPSGEVSAQPLVIEESKRHELEKRLVLVYTGEKRESIEVISSQKVNLSKTIAIYDAIKELGKRSVGLLKKADIEGIGKIMDKHWKLKKQLSDKISSSHLDELYVKFKKLGSPGGKIIGAGGGGFFMMAVPGDINVYLKKVSELGFRYLDWRFEFHGTHLIDMEAELTYGW